MYPVDPISALIVAGLSSLVGAGLLWLVHVESEEEQVGLALFRLALTVLGIGLSVGLFLGGPRLDLGIAIGAALAMSGITLWCGGLLCLGGRGQPKRRVQLAAVLTGLLVLALDLVLTPRWIAVFYPLLGVVHTVYVTLALQRRIVLLRQRVDIANAMILGGLTLSWTVRLILALVWDGPTAPGYLHMPPGWVSVYALAYGALPIGMAASAFLVVNQRLLTALRVQATTDELTGALSRRGFRGRVPRLLRNAERRRAAIGALMVDVDHFKSINDSFGHAVGDEVLQKLSRAMRAVLPNDSLLARFGGEEFAALIAVSGSAELRALGEQLRREIGDESIVINDGVPLNVTISIGASMRRFDEEIDTTLDRADQLLYRAKAAGRNRVFCDPQLRDAS